MNREEQPGIYFVGLWLDHITFQDVESRDERPDNLEFAVNVVRTPVPEVNGIDITLELSMRGDEGDSPFFLSVGTTGRFVTDTAHPNMDLSAFAKTNGPALIMPFVREMVANITARSRNGPVLMPPVNVAKMLEEQEPQQAALPPGKA